MNHTPVAQKRTHTNTILYLERTATLLEATETGRRASESRLACRVGPPSPTPPTAVLTNACPRWWHSKIANIKDAAAPIATMRCRLIPNENDLSPLFVTPAVAVAFVTPRLQKT